MRTSVARGQLTSLAAIALRYSCTVAPNVKRELTRWSARAEQIPDRRYRREATRKLCDAAGHARLNATFATLAPQVHRSQATAASVALEVIYDYLDALTERPGETAAAIAMFDCLRFPFDGEDDALRATPDDGGYLRDLAHASRAAIRALPAHKTIAPYARDVARRCGAAQARCHRAAPDDFESWSRSQPRPPGFTPWEAAAGWCAEVVTLHLLIALAARADLRPETCAAVVEAYLPTCALATLLDSVLDRAQDEHAELHSFVGHYASVQEMHERLAVVTQTALARVASLPQASRHTATVIGVAAYYLSDPRAGAARTQLLRHVRDSAPVLPALVLAFRGLRMTRGAPDRPAPQVVPVPS